MAAVPKKSSHIALIGGDFVGHTMPLLSLAECLVQRGHICSLLVPDYSADNWKTKAEKVGCQSIVIETGRQKSDMEMNSGGLIPFLYVFKHSMEPTRQIFKTTKFDFVVADFFAFAGMELADEFQIPFVINCPSPYGFLRDFAGLPSPGTFKSCGGLSLGFNSFKGVEFVKFMGIQAIDKQCYFCAKHWSKSLVLVNSFWGLEPAQTTYPNFIMTGALLPSGDALTRQLAENDPQLDTWIKTPGAKPLVFISTGSLVELHPWQIREIYNGIKMANMRAVWSLKQHLHEFVPDVKDNDFWISKWVPQAAILQQNQVKAVIYHCGWGGTLEVIAAGKPMICMPFFGDQQSTAKMMVDAGFATLIGPLPPLVFTMTNPWKEGSITADSVARILQTIVSTPSYSESAKRLQSYSSTTMGVEGAVDTIEHAALCGTSRFVASDCRAVSASNPFRGATATLGLGCVAGVGMLAGHVAAAIAATFGLLVAGRSICAAAPTPASVAPDIPSS